MPQTSFALLTNLGRAKEAAALANATTITITHIAIGDGATVPSGGETQLYHEVARKTVSVHGTVVGADNVAYFDCYLAAGDGPYTIREAGLYDATGDLIAIAHYDPAINKPVPSSGQTVEGTVRLEVAFSNIANVVIVVDPSIQVALQRLTRLPWIPVNELNRNAPPASPAVGDSYVIGSSPTGSWAGNAGKVAEFTIAGWAMMTSPPGHGVSIPDGRVYEKVSGTYIEKIALDVQSGKWLYGADTGAVNALVVDLAPAPADFVAGMEIRTKLLTANTGHTTIRVNGVEKSILRQDGGLLVKGDLIAGEMASLVYDGTNFRKAGTTGSVLTTNRTYYVNFTTGSDTANDGLTTGTAFKTIQRAVDVVAKINANGYAVTIIVADGAYPPFVVLSPINGTLLVRGNNATPANCTIGGTGIGDACIGGTGSGVIFSVEGFKLINYTSYGHGIVAQGGGCTIRFRNIEFSTMGAGEHILCDQANVFCYGDYRIVGSAAYHVCAQTGGVFTLSPTFNNTVTIADGPAFTAFAYANQAGIIRANSSTTFVGPGYGSKWSVTTMSLIDTAGAGVNFFPGNGPGTFSTGGYYA